VRRRPRWAQAGRGGLVLPVGKLTLRPPGGRVVAVACPACHQELLLQPHYIPPPPDAYRLFWIPPGKLGQDWYPEEDEAPAPPLPEWRPDLPDWGAYPREKGDHLVPGACPECQAPDHHGARQPIR
jgi:hypothetical protein